MTAETLVLSAALCDPDYVPQVAPVLLRAPKLVDRDPDFVASVEAGFVETDVDAWYEQLGRRP